MERTSQRTLLLISLLLLMASCQQYKAKKETEKIIREWIGKTILFPENINCFSIGNDSICPNPTDKVYKVLLYVDPSGCISCKLQLNRWIELIAEADSIMPGQLKFLFYFQQKKEREMNILFKREMFIHPVYLDKGDLLNQLNHFPANSAYH